MLLYPTVLLIKTRRKTLSSVLVSKMSTVSLNMDSALFCQPLKPQLVSLNLAMNLIFIAAFHSSASSVKARVINYYTA